MTFNDLVVAIINTAKTESDEKIAVVKIKAAIRTFIYQSIGW